MNICLRSSCLVLIGAACLASAPHAVALSFDSYCDLSGYVAPLRQSLIVLDESAVSPEPEGKATTVNMPWRKLIGRLLPDSDSALSQAFEARERVAVMIARKDGAGMKEVFTGCLPFYSAAEKKQLAARAGYMGSVETFFGTDPVTEARKALDAFRVRLGQSIREALMPSALSAARMGNQQVTLASNGFVTSLRQAGAFVNLGYGLPRIIIYSDMTRYFRDVPATVPEARKAGEQAGFDAGIDLKGAEVHVVGMSANPRSRDLLGMFFLAAHGELLSVGSPDMLPSFAAAPSSVARYQGLVRYPDNQFPIRIRLVTDTNGNVLSSWLSVQTSKEQFSPFHGVVTCEVDSSCAYAGDEVFAQVWSPQRGPGKEPELATTLPFGGARILSFKLEDSNRMIGSISDALIRFQGVEGYKLQFNAVRQPKALF